jgi:hypothetical protein
MVDVQTIGILITAISVTFAAIYYISTLRNATRERRRQNIMQKLPPFNKQYYEWLFDLVWDYDWTTPEEYYERRDKDYESKVWYFLNVYNILGMLYTEKLISLDDLIQLYSPRMIIMLYERFEFLILKNRLNRRGEPALPELMAPLENLYRVLKSKYPNIEGWAEHQKLQEASGSKKPIP